MIDLHAHILPGIDDGAPELEASVAMARAAVAGGVETIVGTPHVSAEYQNDPRGFAARVAEVQAALDAAGVPVRVLPGAEINSGMVHGLAEEALRAATLGGSGKWILLEAPFAGPMPFIDRMVDELRLKGFEILLAHPERIGGFQRDIELVQKLVDQGCLCSVTAGSAAGQFGKTVQRFTGELFARGLVHNLASDAHDADYRSPGLRPLLEKAVEWMPRLEDWLPYLTEEVPKAIVAGQTPRGEPPVLEPKRGLIDRLKRR